MRFQVMSDLHLEFGDLTPEPVADHLILAGDINLGSRAESWMQAVCTQFKRVLYITGNHEYYDHDVDEVDKGWRRFASETPNFEFLQKDVAEVEGVRIAGCTLWTGAGDGDPIIKRALGGGMSDFYCISKGGMRFTVDDSIALHRSHRNWLLGLEDIDVVVTHHAPSWQSVTDFWVKHGSNLNFGFAAEIDDVIDHLAPKVWVHGHMHTLIRYWHKDVIGGTEVVCNPRGYVGRFQEHTGWHPQLTIDV